ncbi:hypothetical protein QD409_29780 [Rhizobium sp. BR 315]
MAAYAPRHAPAIADKYVAAAGLIMTMPYRKNCVAPPFDVCGRNFNLSALVRDAKAIGDNHSKNDGTAVIKLVAYLLEAEFADIGIRVKELF